MSMSGQCSDTLQSPLFTALEKEEGREADGFAPRWATSSTVLMCVTEKAYVFICITVSRGRDHAELPINQTQPFADVRRYRWARGDHYGSYWLMA